jgi:hypothetical protein
MRSTAGREIVRGAVGDASEWVQLTGIEPQSLDVALAAEPASVQERWFAQLYFLKPLLLGVLSLFVTLRRGPRVRLAWSCVAGPTVVQRLRRRG